MAAPFKVEIINNEVIKPSSPSPDHPKHLNLSSLDQLAATIYVPLLLFYTKDEGDVIAAQTERSSRLKTSLAEILNQFYPFAGRAKANNSIECKDEGVAYIEARMNYDLSEFLKDPEPDALNKLLPIQSQSLEACNRFLLLVQANFFRCGGMAVALRISHKIADASSLSLFIRSWSAAALCSDQVQLPHFIGDSLFPGEIPKRIPNGNSAPVDLASRRFVFTAQAIDALKAKAASQRVEKPTRVEAVVGIIWKSAMAASREKQFSVAKQSALCQAVNLRKRFSPPLPETTVGNMLGFSIAQAGGEEKEVMELQDTVQLLREAINEFSIDGVKKFQGENAFFMICEALAPSRKLQSSEDVEFYICSSWSRFGFYEADFGWGQPAWVSISTLAVLNSFLLMDAKDGQGIEAWVTLSKEHMASFERQGELILFASTNPSVL